MILEVENISKFFEKNSKQILESVNLVAEKGSFITIMGESGSGKSTLLNVITGFIKPSSGKVMIDGKNIADMSEKELTLYRNEKIGYVMQGHNLLNSFTVLDNILMPKYISSKEIDINIAIDILDRVGLKQEYNNFPKELSGGEARRVAIARALINDPDLVILDEPTSDLDNENAEKIADLIFKLNGNGKMVLVCTHDTRFLSISKDSFILQNGRLV